MDKKTELQPECDDQIHSGRTQITQTVASYRKFIEQYGLESNLSPNKVRVLDFGSGYGHGTKLLREIGYTVHSHEPNYDPSKVGSVCPPDSVEFDGSDIHGKFDLIICNFVINVVDPDTYHEILTLLSTLIKPGTTLAISSASKGMVKLTKNKVKIGEDRVRTSRGTTQKYRSCGDILLDLIKTTPNTLNVMKSPLKLGSLVSVVVNYNLT